MQSLSYHLNFYRSFLLSSWDNMTPMQYGCLLTAIALSGWMLMRHGASH
jgi:hypothetical protein